MAKRENSLTPQKQQQQQAGYRYDIEEYGGWGFGGKYTTIQEGLISRCLSMKENSSMTIIQKGMGYLY